MLIILFLIPFLRITHGNIGFTRSTLYEEYERTSIAWTNEEIPSNLRPFFKFNGTILLVTPPNGLSIEFVIARPNKTNDDFVAEWCAPVDSEYAKCDIDVVFLGNTVSDPNDRVDRYEDCSVNITASALVRRNYKTTYRSDIRDIPIYDDLPEGDYTTASCLRIIVKRMTGYATMHVILSLINGNWINKLLDNGGSLGGLKYIPLPGHSGYQQSGRQTNGLFCGAPFRFPDSGLVFQTFVRRNMSETIRFSTSVIPMKVSRSTHIVFQSTTSSPKLIDFLTIYLMAFIFGGICVGFILFALTCLIGIFVIRQKRKQTFNGQPLFSLESDRNDSVSGVAKIGETTWMEVEGPHSMKKNTSKTETVVQNDCSWLIKADFESNDKTLLVQKSINKNHSIIQFLTQKFKTSTLINNAKSADELLQEALEEPFAGNRTEKFLQVVIKANNELYSHGYRNKLVQSSRFKLSAPSESKAWLKNLKNGDFLRFILSVSTKEIGGKNGEFEFDVTVWRAFLQHIDIPECFRQACLFGQSSERRQFFVMATFYKMALLIGDNSNRKELEFTEYPIPLFINIWEKYPHYFEFH